MQHRSLSLPAVATVAIALTAPAAAQEGVPPPPGLVPEQMWYAPTAEDWQKPVLIRWQRTWNDAVRLSRQTKKPILVCVNMDGEIASEHYAGVRYRDPEIAPLFEPYVCVIASVYRHNPRDHDDEGRRIECPRLGCVTCGEHIAMEAVVYEKFLDGKRISPRHIMVELDGSEVFDVFYTWDTESVFRTLRNGITQRSIQAQPVVKGDRSLRERIQSPDSEDRELVEREFAAASPEERARMLELALAEGEQVPLELLRLAANGLDPVLAAKARQGLTRTSDPLAIELIADTLQRPLLADERTRLVEALARFGKDSAYANTLATAHRGLATSRTAIDASRWRQVLQGQSYSAAAAGDIAAEATARDTALISGPDSTTARLDVAESCLLQAIEIPADRGRGAARSAELQRRMLLEDAERHLEIARRNGASGWRPAAIGAVTAYWQGRRQDAYDQAIAAAPELPPEAPGQLAVALLALFAEARQEAIVAAVRQKNEWPAEWTNDVHAAYELLAKHPLGTDQHAAHHFDFLAFFRSPETDRVLAQALERFPLSALLHERLRNRLLARGGSAAIEQEYALRAAAPGAPPEVAWFHGYALLVVAEHHRRNQRPADAQDAYHRAIASFARYQSGGGNASHYVAMAHAGLARVHLQAGDLDGSFGELQQVFALAPAAAAATDGLGITAMQTAEMLRGKAQALGNDDLVARLQAELQRLPPEAFELPEYEQASRSAQRGRRGR